RPAFGAYIVAPDAETGRRHGDRSCDRRPAEADADRADGRHSERPGESRSARRLRRAEERTEGLMVDLVIRGATVVDGLGHDPKRADVAVKDGKIVAIGAVSDKGNETRMPTGWCSHPASSTCTRT